MTTICKKGLGLLVFCSFLGSCGGGSGGQTTNTLEGPTTDTQVPSGLSWSPDVYFSADLYRNRCEFPAENQQQGSAMTEKMWLRSWTNDLYLWYDEVPDIDPEGYSLKEYFDLLKTTETTPSGNSKDRFHFFYKTEEWRQLQSGIVSGYGASWNFDLVDNGLIITISLVEPGSPADLAGLKRSDRIEVIDGISSSNAYETESAIDALIAGLFPQSHGEEHLFTVTSIDGETRELSLISQPIETQAVFATEIIDTDSGSVGYIAFNSHNLVAQDALVSSFEALAEAQVEDLVLDLRYNGGGLLIVASQLAHMVAGPDASENKTFEKIVFNDKHNEFNPFTGEALTPMLFQPATVSWLGELASGIPLPTLNLSRVYVITSAGTCSASESIINSLRGIDVEVVQVGSTTCGKPYGFYASENCENTYFSINIRGENHKGFGEYSDGFSPENMPSTQLRGVTLPGCYAEDDLNHQLGDSNESMLAMALKYRETNICDEVAQKPGVEGLQKTQHVGDVEALNAQHPLLRIKVLR